MEHDLIKSRDASRAKNCNLLVAICATADDAYLVTGEPRAVGSGLGDGYKTALLSGYILRVDILLCTEKIGRNVG